MKLQFGSKISEGRKTEVLLFLISMSFYYETYSSVASFIAFTGGISLVAEEKNRNRVCSLSDRRRKKINSKIEKKVFHH